MSYKSKLFSKMGLVFLLGLVVFALGCINSNDPIVMKGESMGTTYAVKFFPTKNVIPTKKLHALIHTRLNELNSEMSTYIADSELSKFNKNKSLEWTKISPNFFKVIEHALYLARMTSGVFDPTIGPLVNLWGFGPSGLKKVPTRLEIEKARNLVGFWRVALDKKNNQIRKLIPELFLDLSASAKGFGVDLITIILRKNGINNYMVEIGGELGVGGRKPNGPWQIAIEAPDPLKQGKRYQKVLKLENVFMATSGDYRNFFEADGKKYSHTINYRTGKPVEHTLASVTVVDENSGMQADSWATALMALGPIKGFELAEKLKLSAYFIYRDGGQDSKNFIEKATLAFKQRFKNK